MTEDKVIEKYESVRMRIARCVVGPRFDVPSSSAMTLDALREHKWGLASTFDKQEALNIAASIMRDLHVFPRKKRISNFAFSKGRQERAHFLKTKKAKKDVASVPEKPVSSEA